MRVLVLPSLLASDFGCLAREARRAEAAGADALHLDIMDGHFVPNLSMGPDVVAMARNTVGLPLSVHLMLEHPQDYLTAFARAGADSLLIHVEAHCDVRRVLRDIRAMGIRPGLTLNPRTSAAMLRDGLPLADEVLCMSVQPGHGGQAFMPEVLEKIKDVRTMAAGIGKKDLDIMVDGGINAATAADCAASGANAFVAGTSLFKSSDMQVAVSELREAAKRAWSQNS